MVKKTNIYKRIAGRALQRKRNRIMQEQPLCLICEQKGMVRVGVELDHILPIFKGGDNEDTNLQMLCLDCHRVKTATDLGVRLKTKIGLDGWPVNELGVGEVKTLA